MTKHHRHKSDPYIGLFIFLCLLVLLITAWFNQKTDLPAISSTVVSQAAEVAQITTAPPEPEPVEPMEASPAPVTEEPPPQPAIPESTSESLIIPKRIIYVHEDIPVAKFEPWCASESDSQ